MGAGPEGMEEKLEAGGGACVGPAASSRPRGGRVELEERRAGGKEEVECSVALMVCDLRSCRPLRGRVLGAACMGAGGAEAVQLLGHHRSTRTVRGNLVILEFNVKFQGLNYKHNMNFTQ